MKYSKKMNSLKKGEGVPLLTLKGVLGSHFLTLGGSPVPLLNFEGGPESRVPGSGGPGSRVSGPTFTPCLAFISLIHFLLLFVLVFNFSFFFPPWSSNFFSI